MIKRRYYSTNDLINNKHIGKWPKTRKLPRLVRNISLKSSKYPPEDDPVTHPGTRPSCPGPDTDSSRSWFSILTEFQISVLTPDARTEVPVPVHTEDGPRTHLSWRDMSTYLDLGSMSRQSPRRHYGSNRSNEGYRVCPYWGSFGDPSVLTRVWCRLTLVSTQYSDEVPYDDPGSNRQDIELRVYQHWGGPTEPSTKTTVLVLVYRNIDSNVPLLR